MLATIDYVGLGALIAATCAGVVSIIVALQQRPIKATVDAVHEQVTPSNGETLATITEENDLRHLDPANPPPKPVA